MQRFTEVVARALSMTVIHRRILAFFLLSYGLTWFGTLGNWLFPSEAWPRPMFPFGPIIAAPLVIWLTQGRAGLVAWWRRIIRFRAPVWVYATAIVVTLAIIVSSVGLAIAIGTPALALPDVGGLSGALIAAPIVLMDGPAPEEPAFRGYGQYELQETVSPLVASLWIGLGVLIWHLPVLLLQQIPWPIAFALPAVSVVYAWLYQAGRSIWPLVALHFTVNYFGGEYFGRMFAEPDTPVWTGFLSVFFVAWATLLARRLGPSLGRKPPTFFT
jgi:membrane protease YdiL (CAAX protease family)